MSNAMSMDAVTIGQEKEKPVEAPREDRWPEAQIEDLAREDVNTDRQMGKGDGAKRGVLGDVEQGMIWRRKLFDDWERDVYDRCYAAEARRL